MTTKYYLGQIKRFKKMIENKTAELNQLKTMVYGTTAKNDGERVQTSADKDRLGAAIARILDLEDEIGELVEKYTMIVRQIESVSNTDYYDVLAQRYIFGKDLKAIAIESGVTYRGIEWRHCEAIKMFEDKYGDEYL